MKEVLVISISNIRKATQSWRKEEKKSTSERPRKLRKGRNWSNNKLSLRMRKRGEQSSWKRRKGYRCDSTMRSWCRRTRKSSSKRWTTSRKLCQRCRPTSNSRSRLSTTRTLSNSSTRGITWNESCEFRITRRRSCWIRSNRKWPEHRLSKPNASNFFSNVQ